MATPVASFATAPDIDDEIREEEEFDGQNIEPQWSDARTQAEVAAQLQEELMDSYADYDGDPYGMLDFEGQGDADTSEDEEEVKRAMRSWGIGGWMDGAIEALLMVEQGNAEPEQKVKEEKDMRRVSVRSVTEDDSDIDDNESVQKGWGQIAWVGDFFKRNALL